ncbi:MAG: DUF4143 domain-containing protein [Clostridia bacterium]|nr:DUF4143 domain-containing protein [Clostridia bacterium]
MIERDITVKLIDWKQRTNRKPLIIRGARQVGKTWAIENFAKNHFNNYLKINLEEQKGLSKIFEKKDSQSILDELSVFFNITITAGKTLLFFDEIQAVPEAIVNLRYFYEQNPALHIIAAGSLLDHTLDEMKSSMPVGRVEFSNMFPLSFIEFLNACGEHRLVDYLQNFTFEKPFSELIHSKALEYLRLYYFIGGMPEAVATYLEEKNLIDTGRVHGSIVTTLRYDFGKYGSRKEQQILQEVMDFSANNVGRRFKYISVNANLRSEEIKLAFQKLSLSRIIYLINRTLASGVPLAAHIKQNNFKPLFIDIGLANHIGNIQLVSPEDLTTINEGALAEQFIGQELLTLSVPYLDPALFYWSREAKNSNAELDYLFQHNNKIFPIEVKAGKSGTLKSLHVFLHEKNLKTGIRFNTDMPSYGQLTAKVRTGKSDCEIEYGLVSLPLYMCHRLPDMLNQIPT